MGAIALRHRDNSIPKLPDAKKSFNLEFAEGTEKARS